MMSFNEVYLYLKAWSYQLWYFEWPMPPLVLVVFGALALATIVANKYSRY